MANGNAEEAISLSTNNNPFLSAHVSVKAPAFMPNSVLGWTTIMEAQFELSKISSSQTKFFHAVSALPPEVVSRIDPDILNGQDYSNLKAALLAMYTKSKAELIDELMSRISLTGRPSAALAELKRTALSAGAGEDFVRHRFFKSLPTAIASALAAQKDLKLDQLGALADELVPLIQSQPCLTVNAHSRPSFQDHRARSTNDSAVPMGIRPFRNHQRPRICRAHIYYGEEARTCKPWCRWPSKKSNLRFEPSSRAASPIQEN